MTYARAYSSNSSFMNYMNSKTFLDGHRRDRAPSFDLIPYATGYITERLQTRVIVAILDPKTIVIIAGPNEQLTPVNYTDRTGHSPERLEWVLGGTLVVGAVALTIATAGLGGAIAGAIGTGFWASVAGGAIAGGIVGAASGAMISAGTQPMTVGAEGFSWNKVGAGALSGLATGAIAGGVFGGITHLYSAKYLAKTVSGLQAAEYDLTNAFGTLRSVNGLSGMPFANANIARAVANAAINYNNAYSAYVVAKATSRALYLGFSAAYFVVENYMSDWLGQYF